MTQLLVGTEKGLFVLDDGTGTWKETAHLLDGVEVTNIVPEASGTVLATSGNAGLSRVDVDRGTAVRLGEGTLPQTVRSVAVSPIDPAVVYAGTEPAALYCSRDGGQTWIEDAGVAGMREARKWQYPGSRKPHIRHIAIDRTDPRRMYLAVQIGGVLRTEDGGAHWVDVTTDIDPDVHTIMQHPGDPEVIFAVTGGGGEYPHPTPEHREKPPYPHGRPLYKSADRGKTWTSMSDALAESYGIPIAALGTEHPVLLAGVARGTPPKWARRPEKAFASLIVSEDEGATWMPVSDGLPAPFPGMLEAIEVDSRRNRVYVGTGGDGSEWGPDGIRRPRAGEIYYSNEPKRGWTQIPVPLPEILSLSTR